METDDKQDAILAELRGIRRALRGILFVLACCVVLTVLSALNPGLGTAVSFFAGLIALAAVVGAFLGIGTAKVANKIRQ